jgi:hypothetical protein
MQPRGDLQNAWIMFDHVNHVAGWTSMACHVYNFLYCKVLIISVYDMQLEDIEAQRIMWTKLNQTILKHGFPKPNFKGFMANSAQANWNAIKIVYGSRDPSIRMVEEHTYLFHWIQSLDKHTKRLIRPKLQDEHKVLCH